MNDDTRLTEIYRPEPAVIKDIEALLDARTQRKHFESQEQKATERLSVIPDGVLLRHESLVGTFYRKRQSLRPTILDLNAVPPHLLKPSLAKSIVNELFRQTGEIPPGIEMNFGRGSLYLLPNEISGAA